MAVLNSLRRARRAAASETDPDHATPFMTTLQDADGAAVATHATVAAQADQFLQHGIAAAGRGAGDEAIAWLQKAVALRPDFAAAQANLGLLLVALRRHAEAEPALGAAVALMPLDAALHNALGVAQEALQRYADAEKTYRAALQADPRLAEAHANLGNCLRRLGRLFEAEAHLQRAIELKPAFAVAHFNLGVLLQERGETGRAIAEYRQALAFRPDYVEALNNLGSSLRTEGFLDEARATFERILELRPQQIEAHCNLAQYKTYKAGDPHIEQLLSQQHRLPSLPDDGQVRYWFTLGKMMEDIGRHDESFAAYACGNRAKHAVTPWDEGAHLERQRRIIATFTRERLARSPAPDSTPGPTPIFILGMPRSGTSLLEQVLATLPDIHGAGEITWLTETLQSASGDAGEAVFEFPQTLAGYSEDDLLELGQRYVERIRELAPNSTHVVDKLPDNFMHIGLIHLMLPNARIVHSMRDPMDSCFSCFSRLFTGNNLGYTYDLGTVARYWVSYHELMQHWHAVLPAGRLLDVSYEAMVSDFESQARRLVAYLGVPWDERCLGFHDNRRVVRTASVAQVRKPIYRTSVARWKAYEKYLGELYEVVKDHRPAGA
jgi:tetratricopeptide (TPR) repeat protein